MKKIRKTFYRDAMSTFDGWDLDFSPEEKQRLEAHGGDLIKSGLILDYLKAIVPEPGPTFSDKVARMKGECAANLEGLGLPNPDKMVVRSVDDWRYAPEGFKFDDLAPGEKLGWGEGQCRSDAERKPLGDSWFFFKIYDLCSGFLIEDDIERRYELASRIGEIRNLYEMRLQHLEGVTRGAKVLGGSQSGGDARRDKLEPITKRVLGEMARLIEAGQSQSRAAELTFKSGFGKSGPANRQLWQRHHRN